MELSAHNKSHKNVLFSEKGYQRLHDFLNKHSFSNLFVLVDSNTHQHCLPLFLKRLQTSLHIEVIEIEAGEQYKTLETCDGIWKALSELGADRKSLMINLGGGVVTDLGGFVAAAFKRGIAWINIPTTLLSMVDAAVGGKNGVNLDSLKNQIGIIRPAELVLIDTSFLQTLPAAEMRSGLAEMLKHGLIKKEGYWKKLASPDALQIGDLDQLIAESIEIKEDIVRQDPTEKHIRKSLNFGHTLGHAIESYFLENSKKKNLLHGEAVVIGMILATYISSELVGFPKSKLTEITQTLISIFGKVEIKKKDQEKIIDLLKFDKKNEGGNINFVLLKKIGEPVIDCQVSNELIYKSFTYYVDAQQIT